MENSRYKFRVWDSFKKQMATQNVNMLLSINDDGSLNSAYVFGQNPIMQYTGIKDKNGVEIYEGDIVLADGIESVLDYDFSEARKFVSPIIQDRRHFEKRRSAYKVYWQDNFLQFSFMSLSEPKHSINSAVSKMDLEVIGNIYSNPIINNK